ncbi:MAG TPA: hypothetical protein V6D35_11100 [Candidatus Sericytochromatia bacterium]
MGKAVITPFQENDGGYVRADAGGVSSNKSCTYAYRILQVKVFANFCYSVTRLY